jgi:DnaJ-domain-containing protein 1
MTQMPGGRSADPVAVEARLREILESMAGLAEMSGFRRVLADEARSLFAYLLEQCNGDPAAIDALYAKWDSGFSAPAQEIARPWWNVLGVSEGATLAQARAAYRRVAMRSHPDRGGAGVSMVAVNIAWQEAQQAIAARHA